MPGLQSTFLFCYYFIFLLLLLPLHVCLILLMCVPCCVAAHIGQCSFILPFTYCRMWLSILCTEISIQKRTAPLRVVYFPLTASHSHNLLLLQHLPCRFLFNNTVRHWIIWLARDLTRQNVLSLPWYPVSFFSCSSPAFFFLPSPHIGPHPSHHSLALFFFSHALVLCTVCDAFSLLSQNDKSRQEGVLGDGVCQHDAPTKYSVRSIFDVIHSSHKMISRNMTESKTRDSRASLSGPCPLLVLLLCICLVRVVSFMDLSYSCLCPLPSFSSFYLKESGTCNPRRPP